MTMAWTALFLWPIVCIIFYQRMTLPAALCTTIFGGYLLLPSVVSWDLPMLPPLDKTSIPTFTALVMTAVALRQERQSVPVLQGWIPRSPVVLGLMAMLVIGAFGTVLTNGDPLFYGPRVIVGLQLYDAFSMLLELMVLLTPLFLARRVLASTEGQRTLLFVLVISAVIYCLPTLYEVRMSPQLHRMVYGFFPHSWIQAIRSGGFRPSVFLDHGLSLGIFLTLALVAAAGLYRTSKDPRRQKWLWVIVLLFVTLVLAKSLGALVIAIVLVPVALLLPPRIQLVVAASFAVVVLVYPALRNLDVIPIDKVVSFAESVDPDRAQSFSFRTFHEETLMEKARERPIFGWGGWSRGRVFNDLGVDTSVTDGAWVGAFGLGGWVRYLGLFGLLCWPIIALSFKGRHKIDLVSASIALVLCAKLVDLIPNSGLIPPVWLLAGALIGRMEMKMGADQPAAVAEVQAKAGYRRNRPQVGSRSPASQPRYARSFLPEEDAPVQEKPAPRQTSHQARKTTPGYQR